MSSAPTILPMTLTGVLEVLERRNQYLSEGLSLTPAQQGILLDRVWLEVCDLTKPEARDWWARWLATRLELPECPTAPKLIYYNDPNGPWWRLDGANGNVVFFVSEAYPWTQNTRAGARIIIVPGISSILDPAAALGAACLFVDGCSARS